MTHKNSQSSIAARDTAAMTSSKPHVLIVGAGLGGLTLAQALRKQGISFEIFEAAPEGRFQGWAIGIHR